MVRGERDSPRSTAARRKEEWMATKLSDYHGM